MKTKINCKNTDYPCLKKSRISGNIYLYTSPKTATLVHLEDAQNSNHTLGKHLNNWREWECDVLNSSDDVTLSN